MDNLICECCGREIAPEEAMLLYMDGDKDIYICKECYSNIEEIRNGTLGSDEVITEYTTDSVKSYIASCKKVNAYFGKVKYLSNAASSLNTCGVIGGIIVFALGCLSGFLLLAYNIKANGILSIISAAVAILSGIFMGVFINALCQALAIWTEKNYRDINMK